MSVEENKKVLQRYFNELHNKQDFSKADEILHQDYNGAAGGGLKGLEGFKQYSKFMHSMASDAHYEILDMIAEGDRIAVFGEWRGTWDGVFFGVQGTGQQFVRSQADVYEFKDGKVYRGLVRGVSDLLSAFQKVNILPSTEEIIKAYNDSTK
jgi:predicted ester cyclase